MNLRPMSNPKPWLLAALGALLLAGLAVAFLPAGGAGRAAGAKAFYTVDDGKTWFAADAGKIAPFEQDGRQAVRTYVYRCADGTEFVNHLEQFKPEAKRALEAARPGADGQSRPNKAAVQAAYTGGRQVKRPGETKWVGAGNFQAAARVTAVRCPDGGSQAAPVEP